MTLTGVNTITFLQALQTLNGVKPEGYVLSEIRDAMGEKQIRLIEAQQLRNDLVDAGYITRIGPKGLKHLITEDGIRHLTTLS